MNHSTGTGGGRSAEVYVTEDDVTYTADEYAKLLQHREMKQQLDRIEAKLDAILAIPALGQSPSK